MLDDFARPNVDIDHMFGAAFIKFHAIEKLTLMIFSQINLKDAAFGFLMSNRHRIQRRQGCAADNLKARLPSAFQPERHAYFTFSADDKAIDRVNIYIRLAVIAHQLNFVVEHTVLFFKLALQGVAWVFLKRNFYRLGESHRCMMKNFEALSISRPAGTIP